MQYNPTDRYRFIRRSVLLPIYKLFLLILLVTLFYAIVYNVSNLQNRLVIITIYGVSIYALLKHYQGFLLGLKRVFDLVFAQGVSVILINIAFVILVRALTDGKPQFTRTILFFLAQIGSSIIWSLIGNRIYFNMTPALRIIVIKRDDKDIDFLLKFSKRLRIIDTINASDLNKELSLLLTAEAVFLPNIEAHQRNNIVKFCTEHNIEVIARPKIGDILLKRTTVISQTDEYPVFYYENRRSRIEHRIAKRVIDIILSIIALIPALPVMGVIAIIIKHNDSGPILYKQVRLTKNEKPFKILKFRSMKVDAERNGAVLASENDDRITKVGKVLRRYRLDELPQIINILKGDMSIVGPRPERPEIIKRYTEELPEFNLRLLVKAGLTGYAQVFGRYNTEAYEKLQMDLIYIINQSIYEDLRIMLYTIKTLFMKDATQGLLQQDVRRSRVAAQFKKYFACGNAGSICLQFQARNNNYLN